MRRALVAAAALLLSSMALAASTASTALAAPPKKPVPKGTLIDVTVAEIAAGHAYLKPGLAGGLRRGAKVLINDKIFTVTQATSSFAIVSLGEETLKEGAKGKALAPDEKEEDEAKLKKPRPDSAFEGQWPEAVPPAQGKAVRFVPLGDMDASKKTDIRITALGGGVFPLADRGGAAARAELNARVRAEPFTVPLAFLLDASLQNWFGPGIGARAGAPARAPILRARELMLAYGSQQGFSANIGRMRYAAATLGTLDGIRLRSTIGDSGFAVAAFGGLLPDPLSSTPSLDAQRFGVEASYSDASSSLHPEAAIVLNGSMFDGRIDERRFGGLVGIYPGHHRVGAHFEVGSYPSDNLFAAPGIDLNNAGLDASLLLGALQIGARVDVRKPERSLWLASYLPLSFFCLTAPPEPADAVVVPGERIPPELCDGRTPTRVEGALDATVSLDNVIIAAGATTARDVVVGGLPSMIGGFANGRVYRLAKYFRADAGVSYSTASYFKMLGFTAGPGATLLADMLDVGAYYRFASVTYSAGGASPTQNGFGAVSTFIPSRIFSISLQAEAIRGTDVDALIAFVSAMYRPAL
ncbi:MAG: hypothetical protein KIT84_32130 [Labilithrix sp.]|nr:hypothetical protein [Labilithrix sp.]MCW5815721.1 hypothetical protein [Labilithrix sp.]